MISGAELLEQALHLCRSDRNGAMVAYWTGTAPFVVGVLYFCQSILQRGNADELVLPYSLGLSGLWLWMNFWHSVCCDALWQSVSQERREFWSMDLVFRGLLTNAALQGSGIYVLGVAALITLPFPWAHAFYQNCHVYAARYDLRETIVRAGSNAALWPKQNWQLLSCVVFLGLLLFLNVLMAIALSAQLLNSLFGVRTALVQSQTAILSLPYLSSAACVTFIVLDPIWKAAHVIRCFHGESSRTGADLRLILRRATAAAFLMLVVVHGSAQTVPAERYDRAIKEVLQRPEYEWSGRQPRALSGDSALQRNAEAIRLWFAKVIRRLGEWLLKHLPQPPEGPGGSPSGSGLRWSIAGALFACLILAGIVVFRSRMRGKAAAVLSALPVALAVDVADDSVTADQLPADEWLQLADAFLRSGDTRLAARAVYLAALAQLEGEKLITLGRHKTNLEYRRELTRRARSAPQVSATFHAIAEVFERSWYGRHAVDEHGVQQLKNSLNGLRVHA